jgi:tRNA (guanine-N7-)-methyltransferase
MTEGAAPPRRPIRSFVRREGRLTPGQERAFERCWLRYGIDFADRPLDLPALFGDDHPVYVEIGFGNGEALLDMASRHPDQNYLGIEVHTPGVGQLLRRAEATDCTNLRVIRHDAVEVLERMIPAASLAGVFLFFPDPWHKKRHHKRRLVQPAFVATLARVLRPGGLFHAATDWEGYAQHMLRVLTSASETFENTAGPGGFAARPGWRVETRFERRGQRLGHGVRDLVFRRLP